MTLLLRRILAPLAVAGAIAAIGLSLASASSSSPSRRVLADRPPNPRSTTTSSSPYWTLPPSTTAPIGANPQVAMDAVQWTQVAYPGLCGGQGPSAEGPSGSSGGGVASPAEGGTVSTGFTVDQVSFAQPDPQDQLAIVLVQCGTGAVPVGLYVYEGAQSDTQPDLLQVLVPQSQDLYAGSFSVSGDRVSIQVQSGAPDRDGACCPGLSYTLSWHWSNGSYRPG